MYKKYYSEFLKHHQDKLHFCAHSHHFWPDVTRTAQLEYWDDSARLSDEKWGHVFGQVIPETQKLIAEVLSLKHSEQISFAPNTHEFVARLFSALNWEQPVNLLTTDSEFHSFNRQAVRIQETGKLSLDHVPTEPYHTFVERFITKAKSKKYQMVFLSQVFFNSGVALTISDIEKISQALSPETVFILDGYHAFMAIPTKLENLEGKIYYLGGGYKYAQAGEGACFLVSPKESKLRPIYTGWFASFSTLEKKQMTVTYDDGAYRFMGSTFDPSGIYRLRSVLKLFKREQISVHQIHAYIQSLQQQFLNHLANTSVKREQLLQFNLDHHGHFLTFKLESEAKVKELSESLKLQGIMTDFRGDRLRFGFGLYHESKDVLLLNDKLSLSH